jgi:hypothetical protein
MRVFFETFMFLLYRRSDTAVFRFFPPHPCGTSTRSFKKNESVVEMMGEQKRMPKHKEDDDEHRHPKHPSAPWPSCPMGLNIKRIGVLA